MQRYKKRIRLYAERLSLKVSYNHDGGIGLQNPNTASVIRFSPVSTSDMTCTFKALSKSIKFNASNKFVFDIIQRYSFDGAFVEYRPDVLPLTIQDYIDEEKGLSSITKLTEQCVRRTVQNGQLGGNRYCAEYYNGILILFDDLGDSPTNVVEFSK